MSVLPRDMADVSSLDATFGRLSVVHKQLSFPRGNQTVIALLDNMLKHHRCPQVAQLTLLLNVEPARKTLFEKNRNKIPEMSYMNATDGLDHDATLLDWRTLGIRFVQQHSRRSYGQFACTMSKLRALRWQDRTNTPWMVMLEDDVHVNNASLWRHVLCFGVSYLQRQWEKSGGCPKWDVIRLGMLGDAYLTPLWGARRILKGLCDNGITDNIVRSHGFMRGASHASHTCMTT